MCFSSTLLTDSLHATATYGFIDGEQAFSAALLLVMVNIAFPYREMNASAMDTALAVLQSMAEKGNKYIRACHTLLTKIRATRKLASPREGSDLAREEVHDEQPAWVIPHNIANGQQPQPQMPFNLDTAEDPSVWAEVMDSIGIDMDRQWIGMALLQDNTLEETAEVGSL